MQFWFPYFYAAKRHRQAMVVGTVSMYLYYRVFSIKIFCLYKDYNFCVLEEILITKISKNAKFL